MDEKNQEHTRLGAVSQDSSLDEKSYQLDRHVIYSVKRVEDKQLLYVGVGVSNARDIFVELRDLSVRAILTEPSEIQKMDQKTLSYKLLHIMSEDQNASEHSIALARAMSNLREPVYPFRTNDMRSVYMYLKVKSY